MDDPVEKLLVDVRAEHRRASRSDIAAMRGQFDGTLVDGFARAGEVLERGLRAGDPRGSLGFDDLKRVALSAFDEIAAQALHGLDKLFGGSGRGPRRRASAGCSAARSARCSACPAAPPAGQSRPGAAIWSASAVPSCSCRPAPGGWRRGEPGAAAARRARVDQSVRAAAGPARRRRCSARSRQVASAVAPRADGVLRRHGILARPRTRDGQDTDWIQRFDPRFWTVNFPRPMMASVVTTGPDALRVECEFQHAGDLAGLIWESADTLDHPLLAYATDRDYSRTTLQLPLAIGGVVPLDAVNGPTLTIEGRDAGGAPRVWYVRLWNYADRHARGRARSRCRSRR